MDDQILDDYIQRRKQQEAARVATGAIFGAPTPEAATEGVALGGALGVSPGVVTAAPEIFRSRLAQQQATTALSDAPRTRQWLTDSINAGLAKDDLDNLTWFERGLRDFAGVGGALLDTQFGRGVETGVVSGARMAEATTTLPASLQTLRANRQLELFDTVSGLAEGATRSDIARAIGAGDMDVMTDLGAYFLEATPEERQRLVGNAMAHVVENKEVLDWFSGRIEEYNALLQETQGRVVNFTDIEDAKGFADWLAFNTGQAIPFLAVSLLGGLVAGTPGLAATGFAMGAGDIQTNLFEEGVQDRPDLALTGAVPYAALEFLGPVGRMFRGVGGDTLQAVAEGYFKRLGREVPASAIEEFINEAGQEIISDIAVAAGTGEPLELTDEKLTEWFNAGMAGAAGGGAFAIVTTPFDRQMQRDMDRAGGAGGTAAQLARIDEMAAASRLRERSPEKFREALDAQGLDQNVIFVPADGLRELFQAADGAIDPEMLRTIGVDPDTFAEMVASGQDVAVPLSAYAAHISGTDAAAWFSENGKTSPEEMSIAEAAMFRETMNDQFAVAQEEALRAAEEGRAVAASDQQVYDGMFQQLRDAGRTPDVADREARVWSAFFRTMGERYGADPAELASRFGVVVRGPDQAGLPPSPVPADRAASEVGSMPVPPASAPPTNEATGRNARMATQAGEPAPAVGMVRVWHSGSVGEGETGRWVSSDRNYASNYRGDLPLYYLDLPANDPRVSPSDEYLADQTVERGFTFNFELTPEEAARLTETPRAAPAPGAAPAQDVADQQTNPEGGERDGIRQEEGSRQGRQEEVAANPQGPADAPSSPGTDGAPRTLFQDARATSARGEVSGIPLATRLSAAFGMAQGRRYRTGRELKLDLQQMSRLAQAEAGIDLTTLDEVNIDRLADFVFEDALEALQDNVNAIGWYDRTVTAALEEVAQLHPEILTDPARRLQFTWALAVTSNGLKVQKNFEVALDAYEALVGSADQRFPGGFGIGKAGPQIDAGLAMYGRMLERFDGDHEALANFMNAQVTVRDLERDFDVKISGEGKRQLVRGASILGPKIGNGFFANLYGNFDALTMDRWLMRTVGRWRGTLININKEMIDQKRAEIRTLIDGLGQPERKALSAMLPDGISLRARMSGPQLDSLAASVAKESAVPAWRSEINTLPGGEDLRKLGNALAKYLDGQVEAPAGAKERAFLREVFTRGLDRLRQAPEVRQASNQELTMSDLQALLWYPEKRLYDTAKQTEGESRGYADEEAPDYANAARSVVRNRLGSAGRTGRAGGRPADDGRGVEPGAAAARPENGEGVRGASGGRASFRGLDADVVRTFDGERPVTEISDPEVFRNLISQAQADLGPVGAQVTVYDDYTGKRLFLMDGGYSGFALNGDDIISVFSVPGAAPGGAVRRIMEVAVPEGGRRLDAFDTFLPKVYAKAGFRAVAKVGFSREFAPAGWDYDFFAQEQGNSDPDIAFMVYDPANANAETDNVVESYDDGIAAQDAALAESGMGGGAGVTLNQQMGDIRGSIVLPSGGLAEGETVINLFETADLSTFLHESGHFFLEAFTLLATDPRAPEGMQTDLATIRKFLGAKPGAAYSTEMHETWARGFEAYLLEGKAPSLELADAFARFKAWLVRIYRSARGLNVQINDDIREVMDRMLATDAEIAAAREATGMLPLFTSSPPGMTEPDWRTYQRMARRSQEQAEQKLLAKTMDKIRREKEAWYKDEKKAVRAQVAAGINARPEYRLVEAMANQKWLGDDTRPVPDVQIDRDTLVEQFGEGILADLARTRLGGKRAIYGKQGMPPQEAAELFGFDSAGGMIDALRGATKRQEAIDAETERRMVEIHGDPLADGTIEEEALAAIHNEQQAATNVAEARHIARQLGRPTRTIKARLYQQRARMMIGRMKVRDAIRPSQFLAAERKAARRAQEAFARIARGTGGEQALAEALQAKEQQILNGFLYDEAKKVEQYVSKGRERMRRYASESVRSKLEGGYIEQIDALLEDYDFRVRSARQVQRAESLRAFVDRMIEEGREGELAIDDRLIEEATRTHYSRLSVDELRGLFDTIDNLDHLGRMKRKLIDARDARDFDATVEEVTGAMDASLRDRPPNRVETPGERTRRAGRDFLNLTLNADTLLREMDGREDLGPSWRAFKERLDAGMARLTERRFAMADRLDEIYGAYSAKEKREMGKQRQNAALGGLFSKWDIIALALNTGNQDNFARLTNPDVPGSFTRQQIDAALAELDTRDWRVVQDMWDYIDSFWPEIAAKEQRNTGVAPKKVEAMILADAPAFVTGGYYPIRYDHRLSTRIAEQESKDLMDRMRAGRFGKAQTRNGHTKERKQNVKLPLRLDLSVAHEHLNNVLYDLEIGEPVNNAHKLLRDNRVADMFRQKGKQSDYEALELWLQDTAAGDIVRAGFGQAALRHLRSGFVISRLALNVSTALIQPSGLAQSAVVVGKKAMAKGTISYLGRMQGWVDDVLSVSPIMRERQNTFERDIYNVVGDLEGGPVYGWNKFQRDVVIPLSFYLMKKVQFYTVDMPTWVAAYEKEIAASGNEEKARTYADFVVERAQGSGKRSNLGMMERGTMGRDLRQSEVPKLFTALGSYMFAKGNIAYEKTVGTNWKNPAEVMTWAVDMALLFTLEAVLYSAVKGFLPDDDEDEALWLAKETALSAMATLPFVRDAASMASGFGGGIYGSILETTVGRPLVQIGQGEVDRALVNALVDAGGVFLHLPSTQARYIINAFLDEDLDLRREPQPMTALGLGGDNRRSVIDYLMGD